MRMSLLGFGHARSRVRIRRLKENMCRSSATYWLSNNKGNSVWLEPVIDKAQGTYRFEVKRGSPIDRAAIAAGTKLGRGAKFKCLLTGEPIGDKHIKNEAQAGRLGTRLLATVAAEGRRAKIYLEATAEDEALANVAIPADCPTEALVYDSRYLTPPGYGMTSIDKLFTPRQLNALVTLADLVKLIGSRGQT